MDSKLSGSESESEIVRRMQTLVDHASGNPVDSVASDFAECVAVLRQFWPESAVSSPQLLAGGAPIDAETAKAVDRPLLPQRFGRFEIRRLLGHGGFGVVLLAFDTTLGREVALKIPRPEFLLTGKMRSRFLREAQAAALLDHSGIVPVYEAGEMGPVWYIAAAFVKGPSLAEWLRTTSTPLTSRSSAALVALLADAVQHAHSRGILHRDLKPSNVMLEPSADETSQEFPFVPKLTDFGLAKRMESTDDETQAGTMLGTPRYMAPEQAGNRYKEIGIVTDVYGLGAILYELLSGEPPFVGESNPDLLHRVQHEEMSPTRLRSRHVPKDLETICLKCLEKEQSRRYQSASELANDLRRFLSGEPVVARPIGGGARLARWCRRRPVLAGLCLALAFVTVIGVAGITWQWRRAEMHLAGLQQEAQRAETNLAQAEQSMVDLAWVFEESNLWTLSDEAFRNFMRDKLGEYSSLIANQSDAGKRSVSQPVRATILSLAGHKAALDGDRETADKDFQESIRIWCELLHDQSSNRQFQRALGVTLFSFAAHLRNSDRLPADIGGYQQGQELFDRLTLQQANDPQIRSAYAQLQTELAAALVHQGKHRQAVPAFEDAARLWHQVATRFPEEPEFLYKESHVLHQAALTQRRVRNVAGALPITQHSLEILTDLARRVPQDRRYRVELAHCLHEESRDAALLDDHPLAAKALADSVAAYEQLVQEEPGDTQSRLALGDVLGDLAQIHVDDKDPPLALPRYQRACEVWDQLHSTGELPERKVNRLAFYYYTLGVIHDFEKRDPDALRAFQRGVELFRATADPLVAAKKSPITLAACYVYIGDLLQRKGDFPGAIKSQETAVQLFEELRKSQPNDLTLKLRVTKSREKIWKMRTASDDKP